MASQRVPTSNLVEVVNGKVFQPLHISAALSPSTGSILYSPPNVTRIVGIDFQLTTVLLTAAAGAFTSVLWPSVGFGGILSSQQRVFNSGQAPPLTSNVANGPLPIAAGQSTQLCLMCDVQSYSTVSTAGAIVPVMIGQCNIVTQAASTATPQSALLGPWFSTGINYTAFSATASSMIYTPTAVTNLQVSIGISAKLYAVFIQT
jgi:hypothetical protein